MLLKSFREVNNADKYSTQIHSDISLFLCNKDSVAFYGGLDEMVSINIKDVDNPQGVIYKLPVLIKSMQKYIAYVTDMGGMDIYDYQKQIKKYTTKNRRKVKSRKLYVLKDDLPKGLSVEKIQKKYRFPLIITSKSEIIKVIQSEDANAAIMHFDPKHKKIWILNVQDGELLYATRPKKPGSLTEGDFRMIYKAVR